VVYRLGEVEGVLGGDLDELAVHLEEGDLGVWVEVDSDDGGWGDIRSGRSL
jgi:hypothetical protein